MKCMILYLFSSYVAFADVLHGFCLIYLIFYYVYVISNNIANFIVPFRLNVIIGNIISNIKNWNRDLSL